jgi:sigma-B regulation protein RsbU (phosphoserine phosphatase)
VDANNGCVLIVSDDEQASKTLSHAIEQQGYNATVTDSPDQAWTMLASQGYDVALLDCAPQFNALHLLDRLKADPALHSIPVILLTGNDGTSVLEEGLEKGAVDYLPAPYSPALIQARIEAQMAKRKLHDQEHDLLVKAKLESDIEIGRRIQLGFLPASLPQPPGWEVAAYFRPARQVAGDFYDSFMLAQNRRLGALIADVCDKGFHAAMYMALIRSLFRAYGQQHYSLSWMDMLTEGGGGSMRRGDANAETTAARRGRGPQTGTTALRNAVTLTNDYLNTNHRDNMFATFFFGVIDPSGGSLIYVNGGHNPPAILGPDGTIKARLKPTGTPVGMMPDVEYNTAQAQIDPGDILYTFTDGVTDARSPSGVRFNEERLLPLLQQPAASAAELLDRVVTQLLAHIDTADQFDDITMLAVRRAPEADV